MATENLTDKLWGGETDKAVANFPVSGEPIHGGEYISPVVPPEKE